MSEQYDVMFDLGFSIVANDELGETLQPSEIRYAIIERVMSLRDDEIRDAVGFCNSYVIEEDEDD